MQRAGGLEIADAVMIDDAKDRGVGLVGVAGILDLVEQLGQDDGAHDGVVIGVLVTKNKNVCHGYPPLDMCT